MFSFLEIYFLFKNLQNVDISTFLEAIYIKLRKRRFYVFRKHIDILKTSHSWKVLFIFVYFENAIQIVFDHKMDT